MQFLSSSSSSSIFRKGIMPISWALGDMLDWAEGTFWFLASALLLLPFFFLFLSPFPLLFFSSSFLPSLPLLFFFFFLFYLFHLLYPLPLPSLHLLLSNLLLFLFFLLPLLPFLLLHLLPVPHPFLNSSIFHPYPSYIPSYN